MSNPAPRLPRFLSRLLRSSDDVLATSNEAGLSPTDVAAWVGDPANRSVLEALRELADLQAQWVLSRYRVRAVTRLLEQLEADAEGMTREQVRKACADLLKADVVPPASASRGQPAGDGAGLGSEGMSTLRAALYAGLGEAGDADAPATDAPASDAPTKEHSDEPA